MEGEPRKEPSAEKENPVQERTNEQADVWVLLPGTSGVPHPADNELEEVVARLMRTLRILPPAAAEEEEDPREGVQVESDEEPGESSPDAFERAMTRRREERERQKSTPRQ